MAWAVLLGADNTADIRKASLLAERAVARAESDPDGSYASALALARWRAGQGDDAVRILNAAAHSDTILPQALLALVLASRTPSAESAQANQTIDTIMTRTFGDLSPARVQAVLLLRERLRRSGGDRSSAGPAAVPSASGPSNRERQPGHP